MYHSDQGSFKKHFPEPSVPSPHLPGMSVQSGTRSAPGDLGKYKQTITLQAAGMHGPR